MKRALGRLGAVLEANQAGEQFARLGGHQVKLPGSDLDRVELSEEELRVMLAEAEKMGIEPRDLLEALHTPERKGKRGGGLSGGAGELDEIQRKARRVRLGELLDEAELEPPERDAVEKQVRSELSRAHSPLSQEMTETKGMTWPPDQEPSFTERGAEAVRGYLRDVLGRAITARGDLSEPGPGDKTLYDVILSAGGDQSELQAFYRSSQRSIRKREGRLYKDLVASGTLSEKENGSGKGRFFVREAGAQQVLEHLREWRSKQEGGAAPAQGVFALQDGRVDREPSGGDAPESLSHRSELTSGEAFGLICRHFGVFPRIGQGLSLDVDATVIDIALKILQTSEEQKGARLVRDRNDDKPA